MTARKACIRFMYTETKSGDCVEHEIRFGQLVGPRPLVFDPRFGSLDVVKVLDYLIYVTIQ